MPFDFSASVESDNNFPNVPKTAQAAPKNRTSANDPGAKYDEAIYSMMHGDYSNEVLAFEREIIEAKKKVTRGTAGWDLFIATYGLQEADGRPDRNCESSYWPIARLRAAQQMAKARNLPIDSARELAYRDWARRTEIGTPRS